MQTTKEGVPILQLSLPIEAGRRWGTMTMEISLEDLERRIIQRRGRVWLTAGGVTLLTALLLYLLISRMVLQPLTLLSETAKRVASGKLDARVPKRKGKDQIAVLSRVFNDMTRELQTNTADLEAKVTQRTQELKEVNNALALSNEELEEAVEKLGHLARTDSLTGLLNRRALTEALQVEVRRTERHQRPFTLLMVDVDYFKKFNDAFGHPAGDRLLIALGETLRENLRAMDVVARYGGEEFAVLLGETHGLDALRVADKLRTAVRDKVFREAGDGKPAGRATISIGLATYPEDASSPSGLISQADQALYLAKEAGRDLVVSCTTTQEGGEE
jgi:diguanylate cyclase (GGDEF)-like protein